MEFNQTNKDKDFSLDLVLGNLCVGVSQSPLGNIN